MRNAVVGGLLVLFATPAAAQSTDPWIERVSEDCGGTQYYDKPQDYALMRKQIVTQAATDAEQRQRIAKRGESRRMCINGHVRDLDAARLARLRPAIDRLIADAENYYNEPFNKARAAFEAAPAKYTFLGGARGPGGYKIEEMREILSAFRAMKTLAQTCGTFDYAMPPMDNRVLQARQQQRMSYARCVQAYRGGKDKDPKTLGSIRFGIVTRETEALAPYICSKWKVQDCIPDANWRAFASVTNARNFAFVEKMDKAFRHESYTLTDQEIRRTNQWQDNVKHAVERYNRGS